MKIRLFCTMALLAAGAAAPASAGKVYIPFVDRTISGTTSETEIRLANSGAQERRYELSFLPADTNGTLPRTGGVRSFVAPGQTIRLNGVSAPGTFGLIEIDAAPQILIDARLTNAPAAGPVSQTQVPVISSDNALAAGQTVHLLGLTRSNSGASSDLGVVNLDSVSAQCGVAFTRADGSPIGGTIDVTVQPLSLSHFTDALGVIGETQAADVRVRVSCNRAFYSYATVLDATTRIVSFSTPAATGASTLGGGGAPPPPPPPPAGDAIVFESRGVLHEVRAGNEIRQINVPVTRALSLRRFTAEWDVLPGPWTPTRPDASHNIIWIHRGRYRSNTIANVNAFGPNRNVVRSNQNVDMAAGRVTNDEELIALQQGVVHHFRYVYDAENRTVTLTISANGATLATLQYAATANDNILTIPSNGFQVQFGHTAAQGAQGSELPTYGWLYGNLRIEMVPY